MTAPLRAHLDEQAVERAARAMHEIPEQPGVYGRIPWGVLIEQHREAYRQMVWAAFPELLAALREAADREDTIRALADELDESASHYWSGERLGYSDAADRLRALLPAPDHGQPTGEEGR